MANLTTTTATTLIRLLLDNASAPYFTDAEIASFLELSIKEFIDKNYLRFEESQKHRDNLRTIVTVATGLTVNNNILTLPSDYRHFLSLSMNNRAVKMIQIDDHEALRVDPFNAPSLSNPACTLTDAGIYLYPTSIVTSNIVATSLTYLSWDDSSDDITSLPDHTHEEVVNITVRKLMANTKDDAYQVQTVEERQNKM